MIELLTFLCIIGPTPVNKNSHCATKKGSLKILIKNIQIIFSLSISSTIFVLVRKFLKFKLLSNIHFYNWQSAQWIHTHICIHTKINMRIQFSQLSCSSWKTTSTQHGYKFKLNYKVIKFSFGWEVKNISNLGF